MSCLNKLKEQGLKLTPQRRLIVDMIHDSRTHLTAEDIITGVQRKMPGVNKTTIYRTLELLEEIGCVLKGDSADRSIYHPTEEGHHHHLVCRKCGKSIACEENLFSQVEQSLAERYGFATSFKHTVVNGLCQSCQKALN
jgi:Fur family ferric uptake transcriptional regulator